MLSIGAEFMVLSGKQSSLLRKRSALLLKLREDILFEIGFKALPFELEFLKVSEFLNNKNSLV